MTEEELNRIQKVTEKVIVRVLSKEVVPIVISTSEDVKEIKKMIKVHEKRLDKHAVAIDRLLRG